MALVAGASRGAGRAIAIALGKAGYQVIVSARSTRFGARTESRSETIEDTAEDISAFGAPGAPYVCDHLNARELQDFARWFVRRYGRIDVLVHAVWGGAEGFDGTSFSDGSRYGAELANRTLSPFVSMMETGPYALLLTLKAFEPLLRRGDSPIAIVIGDDPEDGFHEDIFYDVAKSSVLRLVTSLSPEFNRADICLCHLSLDALATERAVDFGRAGVETHGSQLAGAAVVKLLEHQPRRDLAGASLFMRDYVDIGDTSA